MPDAAVVSRTTNPQQNSRIQRERNAVTIRISRLENGYLVTQMRNGQTWTYQDDYGHRGSSRGEVHRHIDEFFDEVEMELCR